MTLPTHHRLKLLSAAMRDARQGIEAEPALARLLASDLTQREYVALLQHLETFHAHVEPAIAARLKGMPAVLAMLEGSRPRAVAEDLAFFGATLLQTPYLPALEGPAGALVAPYALEVFAMDAGVIARHLADALGARVGGGGSFYCGQDTEAAGGRWRHFVTVLETTAGSH